MFAMTLGKSARGRETKLWIELAAAYGIWQLVGAAEPVVEAVMDRIITFFWKERNKLDLDHEFMLEERAALQAKLDDLNGRIDTNRARRAEIEQATAEAEAERAAAPVKA